MKKMIICEGKTDAILISYFLKQFKWTYTKKQIIPLSVDKTQEELNWYAHPEKPNQELAIWGVGGLEQIPVKLKQAITITQREINSSNRFNSLVIFFDRDTRTETQCLEFIADCLANSGLTVIGNIQIGEWLDTSIELIFKTPLESYAVSLLPVVLPPDSLGNLEIFLLKSLEQNSSTDRQLVAEAGEFVNRIPSQPYLPKQRLRSKAHLGAVLSVMSPDWVFSELDRRLTLIPWEEIESILKVYAKLGRL